MSIDEYFLRQASIFELRNIARDMGVLSPTVYKKEDLIAKVLKIQKGEEKPQMPKSRQGRPPKSVFATTPAPTLPPNERYVSYRDIVAKSEPMPKKTYLDRAKNYNEILANSDFNYMADAITSKQEKEVHSGYFNVVDGEFGFIFDIGGGSDVDDVIFVPQGLIKNCGLRSGDVIEYKSAYVQSANAKFVYEILSINNNENLFADRPLFNKLQINLNEESKSLGLCEIGKSSTNLFSAKCGSRNVVCVKNNGVVREALKKFRTLKGEYYFINLFIDVMPEDIARFVTAPNVENFYTPIGESNRQNIQTIELAIERAKRLVEDGKKVILIASEAKKIIKQKNFSLDYCAEDIKYKTLDFCYQLLCLSRNLTNGASITSFLFLKLDINPSSFEKYILEEFNALDCNLFNLE